MSPDTLTTPSSDCPLVLTEIEAGDGLTMAAAGRLFPGHKGGKAVDPSTVFRWRSSGSRKPDGSKVKLESVRVGSRWLTSKGAIARFVAALSATPDLPPTPSPHRSAKAANRASELAAAKLKAMGA